VRSKGACISGLLAASLALSGCALFAPPPPPPPPAPPPERIDASVYQRVAVERAELLERENERLRADLRAAEETLLAVESGMRGMQGRAEAVSMLAEARIQVDRAATRAPWRRSTVAEARKKLDEAERQLADGHFGSAIFFVSRASRIAAGLDAEADLIRRSPGARSVKPRRANLRAGPTTESDVLAVLTEDLPVFIEGNEGDWALVRTVSGQVGWVRGDLLGTR
jgi:Bacterial SH3 domain